MNAEPRKKPITISIVVWGFSIHAKRRIEVFAEDPRFHVVVISNYLYEIPGVEVFLIPSGNTARECTEGKNRASRLLRYISQPGTGLFLRAGSFMLTRGYDVITEFYNSMQDIRAIKRKIAGCRPEIIFLQTLLYPTYLTFFIRTKVPIMITFWNGDVIWWAKYTLFETVFKKQIVKRGIHRAKALTVNSQSAFDACRSIGKDVSDIHLIRYPGVDINTFKPGSRAEAQEKLHISSDCVILWPRGAGYYHNVQTLLRAVPGLVTRYPDILFILLQVIQGDNMMNKDIADWIGLHPQYRQNFLCLGNIPHEMMPDFYHASDMMISLSSHDSLPNSMLEAMACKIPLIMGDIPQIREWVEDGKNGYLVPVDCDSTLSDRIVRIREDRQGENEQFVLRNRELIEREFDSQVIKERIKDLVVMITKR